LATVLEALDKDDKIGCIVLTGNTRAFAGNYIYLTQKQEINIDYYSRCGYKRNAK
jgi:hypothetical protein